MDVYPFFLRQLMTDASGWPDTITVKISAGYDHTADDGTRTTITGEETFTYTRASLSDKLERPELIAEVTFDLPDTAEFLPVQSAVGKMPGWIAIFGAQDPVDGSFTQTVTHPPDRNGNTPPPTVTQIAGTCNLLMTCGPCAPARHSYGRSEETRNVLYGFNNDVRLDTESGEKEEAYTVEQVRLGAAATATQPERGNVYRVTLPHDVAATDSLTVSFDGVLRPVYYTLGGYGGGAFEAALPCHAYQRSPLKLDVALKHYGDTLVAGTVKYYARHADRFFESSVTVNGRYQKLDDPFPMTGQAFHFEAGDDEAFSIDVQC